MALRSGSRTKRAGAHRASRPPSPARPPVVGKGGDSRAGVGVGLRSRAVLVRTSVVVVLAAIVGVGVAYGGPSSAEPTVYRFLLDWQSKQYLQAARLTTGQPRLVATQLSAAYRQLDATYLNLTMAGISQHGNSADARFDASIALGSTGLVWSYLGGFSLRDGTAGWQIVWRPSVIMPKMRAGERLAVVSKELPRAELQDASGQPLTVPSLTYEVGVIPGQLADPTATASQIADVTGLQAGQVEGQIEAAPSREFLELVTLSPGQFRLRTALSHVAGVIVKPVVRRLFDSIAPDVVGTVGTEAASVLRENGLPYLPGTTVGLSGLQQYFQKPLTGTPRTEVVLQRAGVSVDVLKIWKGSPGRPVRTTLEADVQLAADRALAHLPTSAAIVAVQPGSGGILAVASHAAAGMPALNPLDGQYRPGQAFTIVSSAAILGTGVTPGSTVSCYQNNPVDGQSFVNDPREKGLGGDATFQKDFEFACSTAFAGLSMYLTSADLAKAAAEFGIGSWQLPLGKYFAGSIGQFGDPAKLAADTIGDGAVRMSPLDMALAAAVVDSGRWHPPSLAGDPSSRQQGVMSAQVLTNLRQLMHEAATSGSGKAANVGGDVFGQVGSAPFGAHGMRISWFVGYRGNGIAFAVVELSKSATDSAAPLAGQFLRNIRTGS